MLSVRKDCRSILREAKGNHIPIKECPRGTLPMKSSDFEIARIRGQIRDLQGVGQKYSI